jgi:hypothetical protein
MRIAGELLRMGGRSCEKGDVGPRGESLFAYGFEVGWVEASLVNQKYN